MERHSRKVWQDVYYDVELDDRCEAFDEDSQEVIRRIADCEGWGIIDGKGYIEDFSDTYYLKMKNGEIKRHSEVRVLI